ncbi:MAG: M48 family metallopeptidase [Nitrososphaeraceae archaeon]
MSVPVSLSNGQILNIKIKRSTRSKSVRLEADIYGIHVVAPANYEVQNIIRFIHTRKNWISKIYKYYGRFVDKFGQESVIHEDSIAFLGSIYKLQIVKDKIPFNVISDNLKLITFHVRDRRKYKEAIRTWYKGQTSKIIFERLPRISSKLDLGYNRVLIKSQKSRWGSCSKNKNLNFNLFLAALPSEIIDYVIIHELMHLKELNHSKRFWELVNIEDPDYKYHRKVLSRYSCITNL